MIPASVVPGTRRRQNHAALIALDAAEKGGRLLQSCEKSPGGRPEEKTPATLAVVSEYRKAIESADLSERTAELGAAPAREGRNQASQNRRCL